MHTNGAPIDSSICRCFVDQSHELHVVPEADHGLVSVRPRIESTIGNETRSKHLTTGAAERTEHGVRR